MRLMITSAWSRMRRREEPAQKLVSAGRLIFTNSDALVPDYAPKITTLTSRSPSLEHCRQRFASN